MGLARALAKPKDPNQSGSPGRMATDQRGNWVVFWTSDEQPTRFFCSIWIEIIE
jgi:hypothetical protein